MKRLQLIAVALFLLVSLQAQVTLPQSVKIYLPSYLQNAKEKLNSDWMGLIKKENYGKNTKTFWTVFSDRSNNPTFKAPNSTEQFKILTFKQKLKIADIKDGFALVYTEGNYEQIYPNVSAAAQSMGWISLDNLLLWVRCPMDKDQVFRKAVVLRDTEVKNRGEITPSFLANPKTKDQTNLLANDLEFYFIMKKQKMGDADYYLLSKEWSISSSIGAEANLYGWLSEGNVSPWNNRLCFEVAWDGRAVSEFATNAIKPMIGKEPGDATQYMSKGKMTTNNVIWQAEKELSTKRTHPQSIRFPLISNETQLKKGIYRVATIGNIGEGSNEGGLSSDKVSELKKEIQEDMVKANSVNIIFVVDGTASMAKYFKPLADAIDKSMRKDLKHSYKFGAVVYRDYTDGDRQIEKMKLTDNYENISNFLNRCEASQPNGKDKNMEEAMYLGLETALDEQIMGLKKEESNFVFLIGDCGNHDPDPQGKNIDNIIKALTKYRVNLLAFQANNVNNKAFDSFILQSKSIIMKTIDAISKEAKATGTVGLELDKNKKGLYRTFRKTDRNDIASTVDAYTFCNPNENKNPAFLGSLVEDMIREYGDYVSKKIAITQSLLNGSNGSDRLPSSVLEILRLQGFSDAEIKVLITRKIVVKIAGYTCDKPGNSTNEIFVPILFISHEEFIDLLKQLSVLNSSNFVSNRTAYYEALKSLANTFFGNTNVDQIEIQDLMAQMYGIPFKPSSLAGVKIIDILDTKRVTQDQLSQYIESFQQRLRRLEKIKNNEEYTFLSNGLNYYWIPVVELP